MRDRLRSLLVANVCFLVCSAALGQSTTGTFSGSAAHGLGAGQRETKDEDATLTKATLDAWVGAQVKELNQRLRAAKKGLVTSQVQSKEWIEKAKHYKFRSRAERDAEIKRLESEIQSPTLPSLWPFALKVQQIGCLNDPLDAVGLQLEGDGLAVRPLYRVTQIVDEQTALIQASAGSHEASFFLISPLVREFQEDQTRRNLPGVFIVDGTRRYTTVIGGVRTLPVLRQYDLKPHLAKLRGD